MDRDHTLSDKSWDEIDSGYTSSFSMNTSNGNSLKDLLIRRIFFGIYTERKLLEGFGYRDFIQISCAEEEFCSDLTHARKLLMEENRGKLIGILEEFLSSKVYLLVKNMKGCKYGPNWFQITDINFEEREVTIDLLCLGYVSQSFYDFISFSDNPSNSNAYPIQNKELILKNTSTIRVIFLIIFDLFMEILSGINNFLLGLGNFAISFYIEFSHCVYSVLPVIYLLLEFMISLLRRFYIISAIIFTPRNISQQFLIERRRIEYASIINHKNKSGFIEFD